MLRILKDGYRVSFPQIALILDTHIYGLNSKSQRITAAKVAAQWAHMGRNPSKLSADSLRASFPTSIIEEEKFRSNLDTIAAGLGVRLGIGLYNPITGSNGVTKEGSQSTPFKQAYLTPQQDSFSNTYQNSATDQRTSHIRPQSDLVLPLTPPMTASNTQHDPRFVNRNSPTPASRSQRALITNPSASQTISKSSMDYTHLPRLAFRG